MILLGEHAVVYGHPALAGALSAGVTVEAVAGEGRLVVPAWGLEVDAASDEQVIARAYAAIRGALGVGASSEHDFVVTFGVPTGAGLGSSAALAVALAREIANAQRLVVDDARLAAAAMASEVVVHGRPSGLDHTLALRGGFGVFTRGQGLTPVHAGRPIELVIGHTGRDRDTRGRVVRVAELLAERPGEVRAIFAGIETLVRRGRDAVERGALEELGQAMNENQRHLEALEVSCPEIEAMCRLAREAGALGAKLTGAGGGGCVIALAPGGEGRVRAAWEGSGFETFVATVG